MAEAFPGLRELDQPSFSQVEQRFDHKADETRCLGLMYAEEDALRTMTDPKNLKKPLTELLHTVEQHDAQQATEHAKALITELEEPSSIPEPRDGERRQAPVPFSGLFHAVQREMRSVERLVAAEKWESATKVVKETIGMLPF